MPTQNDSYGRSYSDIVRIMVIKRTILMTKLKKPYETASARFSNYDQIMILHCFQSRAQIPKMKDQSIVFIVSLLIFSPSVKANKEKH